MPPKSSDDLQNLTVAPSAVTLSPPLSSSTTKRKSLKMVLSAAALPSRSSEKKLAAPLSASKKYNRSIRKSISLALPLWSSEKAKSQEDSLEDLKIDDLESSSSSLFECGSEQFEQFDQSYSSLLHDDLYSFIPEVSEQQPSVTFNDTVRVRRIHGRHQMYKRDLRRMYFSEEELYDHFIEEILALGPVEDSLRMDSWKQKGLQLDIDTTGIERYFPDVVEERRLKTNLAIQAVLHHQRISSDDKDLAQIYSSFTALDILKAHETAQEHHSECRSRRVTRRSRRASYSKVPP
jgi:hypothetical protein